MPYIIDDSGPNASVRYDEQGAYPTIAAAWEALNEKYPLTDDDEGIYSEDHEPDVYWSGTGELMNDDSYIDYLNG